MDHDIFLESQKVTGINAESSQNVSAMYKLVNFSNLMKKIYKNTELYQKVAFWPDLLNVHNLVRSVKSHGGSIAISKFPQRKNERLLEDMGGVGTYYPSPLILPPRVIDSLYKK